MTKPFPLSSPQEASSSRGLQEISEDRSIGQLRAIVLCIGSAADQNLLKDVQHLFNWLLSRAAELELPITGTVAIATVITHCSSQTSGYAKQIGRGGKAPARCQPKHTGAQQQNRDIQ